MGAGKEGALPCPGGLGTPRINATDEQQRWRVAAGTVTVATPQVVVWSQGDDVCKAFKTSPGTQSARSES